MSHVIQSASSISARKSLAFCGGFALMFLMSGNAIAETSNAYCKAASGLGYWIYEINDEKNSFRLRDDSHIDFLKFPLKESEAYKERVVSFSKDRIEYCRLIKYRNDEACYTLDRVKWELTTQHHKGFVDGEHAAHGHHGMDEESDDHAGHANSAAPQQAMEREALDPIVTKCSPGLPGR